MKSKKNIELLLNIVCTFFIISFLLSIPTEKLWFLLFISSCCLLLTGIFVALESISRAKLKSKPSRTRDSILPQSNMPSAITKGVLLQGGDGILLMLGGVLFAAGALVRSNIPEFVAVGMPLAVTTAVVGFVLLISSLFVRR